MDDSQIIKSQSRIVSFMDRLRQDPPNCILLEGGSPREQMVLASYWAMSLNCRSHAVPCLQCRPCIQIRGEACRDLFFLGPDNKVKEIRGMRTLYAQRPHYSWRVIIISEVQSLRAESANALLKTLEEPRPGNSFVMLAPQRESIFPTLASRSFILTLNRSMDIPVDEQMEAAFGDLAHFARTGKGWLDRTSGKNKLDMLMARQIITRCRHELILSMIKKDSSNLFHSISPAAWYQIQAVIKKAEHCLGLNNIRVDLVLEWMGFTIWKKINQRNHNVYRT